MNDANVQSTKSAKDENKLAIRLTFSYKGEKITLVSQQTLRMTPPTTHALKPSKKESGFWYEIRDANNRTQFRRSIQSPIQHYIEVRSGHPDRPLAWEKVEEPSGIFTLLVPMIKGIREVKLFSSPPSKEIRSPAKEIARFVLKDSETRKEK